MVLSSLVPGSRLQQKFKNPSNRSRRFLDIVDGIRDFPPLRDVNELLNGHQRCRLCSQNRSIRSDGGFCFTLYRVRRWQV